MVKFVQICLCKAPGGIYIGVPRFWRYTFYEIEVNYA